MRWERQSAWRDFQEQIEPLRPTLYRYCRHLTRSPWDAEDLVQDAFARAFASLGALQEPPRDLRAWMFRVASNLWIDRMRRRSPRTPAPDGHEGAPSRDMREAAGTLLVQLSPQERAAVVLKDAFDLPLEDIADILSTSVGAVKAALHRGRGKLADPDRETERRPAPGALDAFCAAFNAGDLDRVAALLLDGALVEVVGASLVVGRDKARTTVLPGMLLGIARIAAPEDGGQGDGDPRISQGVLPRPARLELRHAHGEPILLSWYQHRDGVEAVRAVSRVEIDAESGQIARLWNYFFTPEVIAEVSTELGLPHRTNGTFSPCLRPVS